MYVFLSGTVILCNWEKSLSKVKQLSTLVNWVKWWNIFKQVSQEDNKFVY